MTRRVTQILAKRNHEWNCSSASPDDFPIEKTIETYFSPPAITRTANENYPTWPSLRHGRTHTIDGRLDCIRTESIFLLANARHVRRTDFLVGNANDFALMARECMRRQWCTWTNSHINLSNYSAMMKRGGDLALESTTKKRSTREASRACQSSDRFPVSPLCGAGIITAFTACTFASHVSEI